MKRQIYIEDRKFIVTRMSIKLKHFIKNFCIIDMQNGIEQ